MCQIEQGERKAQLIERTHERAGEYARGLFYTNLGR
jgi:hypothetical protein